MDSERRRVIRHKSDVGEWETVFCGPDPRLRAYVQRYAGWVERTAFSTRRELPSTSVVLIISFRPGLRIAHRQGADAPLLVKRAFAGGMCDLPILTSSDGESAGLQVNFTPIGARLFFGAPMTELTNRSVELEDLLGTRANALVAQIEDTPDWDSRFEILEETILRRLSMVAPPPAGVAWAWEQLRRTSGNVAIGSLAQNLGWSRRHFIEQFKDHIGLAPKPAGRVIRLERAVAAMQAGRQPLAHIALGCGYYDQAHFNREFLALAGSTPRDYLRRLLPDNGGLVEEMVK